MTDPGYTKTYTGGFAGKRWHRLDELWLAEGEQANRPCTVCGTATVWKRPRKLGAATHPLCEGTIFDTVTHELYLDVLFALAAQLGATVHTEDESVEIVPTNRRLGNPQAGCELCGRSHAALWIGARTWRCPAHPPADETYRRRW